MKSKNKIIASVTLLVLFIGMLSVSVTGHAQDAKKKPWVVPDNSKTAKNPVKSDAVNTDAGKALYTKHCKSCHGVKGLGDGPKSKELDTPAGDFSTDLKDQTDGELFYKTKEGRDDMPAFGKKIPDDNEIWSIVNYMRTLAAAK